MTYEEHTNRLLVGKTIAEANISGYSVYLKFTDGLTLTYESSDGGYSCWGLYSPDGENIIKEEGGTK